MTGERDNRNASTITAPASAVLFRLLQLSIKRPTVLDSPLDNPKRTANPTYFSFPLGLIQHFPAGTLTFQDGSRKRLLSRTLET